MAPTILFTLLAGLLAWVGARWSLTLPHYEDQRRAIPQRTLVTVSAALLSAGIAAWLGETTISKGFMALWSVVFTLVAVIDIETHFIPNVLILPATGLALLASLLDPRLNWRSALFGALLGLLLFYLITFIFRGGFGMGDVTLSGFIGAVVGLLAVTYAILAGILVGGVGAIVLLATKRMGRRSFMPYGPYLCVGGWLAMLPPVLAFWGIR